MNSKQDKFSKKDLTAIHLLYLVVAEFEGALILEVILMLGLMD